MAPSRALHTHIHVWAIVRLQSWFRMCLVRNVLFVAKQRFNIAATAINQDLQRLCPGYTYQEGMDCILMNDIRWPIFQPLAQTPDNTDFSEEEKGGEEYAAPDNHNETDYNAMRQVLEDLEAEERRLERAILDRIKVLSTAT